MTKPDDFVVPVVCPYCDDIIETSVALIKKPGFEHGSIASSGGYIQTDSQATNNAFAEKLAEHVAEKHPEHAAENTPVGPTVGTPVWYVPDRNIVNEKGYYPATITLVHYGDRATNLWVVTIAVTHPNGGIMTIPHIRQDEDPDPQPQTWHHQ